MTKLCTGLRLPFSTWALPAHLLAALLCIAAAVATICTCSPAVACECWADDDDYPIILNVASSQFVCVGAHFVPQASASDYDVVPGTQWPICATEEDGTFITYSGPSEYTTPGCSTISVTADDVGDPYDDASVTKTTEVCAFGGPLSGGETLYYHCDTQSSQTITISAAPSQITPGTTYSWSVSGPLTITGSTTGSSVSVTAADPSPGQCAGTVTCTYSYRGHSCVAQLSVPVRKPYSAVAVMTKHVTYDDEHNDKDAPNCVSTRYSNPETHIWGWVWDFHYMVYDQCAAAMDDVPGMRAEESWSGDYQPDGTGGADVLDGEFGDCVTINNFQGPVEGYDPALTGTQTWSVWGCPVITITWTAGNTDATHSP